MMKTYLSSSKEIWKDVKGFEGLYQVSNKGNVKSLWYWSNKYNQRYYREKILKQKIQKNNIARVTLCKGGKPYTISVYRLVLSAFTDYDIKNDLTVNHIDGNRLNNSLENLEWCSIKENIQKGFEMGLYTNCYKTIIYDKETGLSKTYYSMVKACESIGRSHSYIHNSLKRGKTENERYRWTLCSRE